MRYSKLFALYEKRSRRESKAPHWVRISASAYPKPQAKEVFAHLIEVTGQGDGVTPRTLAIKPGRAYELRGHQ